MWVVGEKLAAEGVLLRWEVIVPTMMGMQMLLFLLGN
jgi:hypothetical protein